MAGSYGYQGAAELRSGKLIDQWEDENTRKNTLTFVHDGQALFHVTRNLEAQPQRCATLSVSRDVSADTQLVILHSLDRLLKSSPHRPAYEIDPERLVITLPEKAPGATVSNNFMNFAQSLKRRLVLPDGNSIGLLAEANVKLDRIGPTLFKLEGNGQLIKPEAISGHPAVDFTEFLKGQAWAADVCKVNQAAHLAEKSIEL